MQQHTASRATRRLFVFALSVSLWASTTLSLAAPNCATLAAYRQLIDSGLVADQHFPNAAKAGFCGPTCMINVEQLARAEMGRSVSHSPKHDLAEFINDVSRTYPQIYDGLMETSLLALMKHRSPGQNLNLTVLDSHVGINQPAESFGQNIRFKSTREFGAIDLNLAGQGQAKIIAVDFTQKNTAHFLLVVAHDPANKRIYYSDPNRPLEIAEATYSYEQHPKYPNIKTLKLQCRRNCKTGMDGDDVYLRSIIDARYESNFAEREERSQYERKRLEQLRVDAQNKAKQVQNAAYEKQRLLEIEKLEKEASARRAAEDRDRRWLEDQNRKIAQENLQARERQRRFEQTQQENRRKETQRQAEERQRMTILRTQNPQGMQIRIEIAFGPIRVGAAAEQDQGALRDVQYRAQLLQDTIGSSEMAGAD